MEKTNNNLTILTVFFCTALIISNVVVGKILPLGFYINGAQVTISGGILCYVFTYLATDICGEIWGKDEANKIVKYGFIAQVTATLLIVLTQYLPGVDPSFQESYVVVLGQNYIFVGASLVAYLCSQSWDVFIFHKIRNKWLAKFNDNKHRWIWNNASTMTSQLIDTVIFTGISFGVGMGWLFVPEMRQTLFNMMIGQYLVKFMIAALDTPFFYFFTRKTKVNPNATELNAE